MSWLDLVPPQYREQLENWGIGGEDGFSPWGFVEGTLSEIQESLHGMKWYQDLWSFIGNQFEAVADFSVGLFETYVAPLFETVINFVGNVVAGWLDKPEIPNLSGEGVAHVIASHRAFAELDTPLNDREIDDIVNAIESNSTGFARMSLEAGQSDEARQAAYTEITARIADSAVSERGLRDRLINQVINQSANASNYTLNDADRQKLAGLIGEQYNDHLSAVVQARQNQVGSIVQQISMGVINGTAANDVVVSVPTATTELNANRLEAFAAEHIARFATRDVFVGILPAEILQQLSVEVENGTSQLNEMITAYTEGRLTREDLQEFANLPEAQKRGLAWMLQDDGRNSPPAGVSADMHTQLDYLMNSPTFDRIEIEDSGQVGVYMDGQDVPMQTFSIPSVPAATPSR